MSKLKCYDCDVVDLLLAVNLYKSGSYQLTVDDISRMRDVIDHGICSPKVKEYFRSVIELLSDADVA